MSSVSLRMSAAGTLEPVRHTLALTLRLPDRKPDAWEELVWEHECSYLYTPPRLLLPELTADVIALELAIRDATDESIRRRLCVPCGKLAALVAMTLACLGNRRQARSWWDTACQIADVSTVLDLRVWTRGYAAMSQLYAQPVPVVALRRAEQAIAMASEAPCIAVLESMAVRAQALALMGDTDSARKAILTMERHFDAFPPASANARLATNAWPETGLRHTQAFVYTHLRDSALAERYQSAALALYPPAMSRQRTQIELLRAIALVQDGDIVDGVRYAQAALDALGVDRHTALIQRCATRVLAAVPEVERRRAAVTDYRARISSLATTL